MALGAARRPRLAPDAPLEALLGSDVALCDLLRARKVKSAQELLYTPPWELRDWLLVSEAQATAVLERAWAACAAPTASAWDALQAGGATVGLVPTPLASLNEALAGSLSGTFVEAAGPPGAGKTQLCLHVAALTAVSGGEVFWLDAERTFSPPRVLELLQSICRGRAAAAGGAAADPEAAALAALQHIRRRVCTSLQELHGLVTDLLQRAQQGDVLPALLVVDSIAALARNTGDAMANQQSVIPQRQRALSSLAGMLKMLAATPIAPDSSTPPGILVTNQVMGDPNSGGSKVALGHVWAHAVNWRLVLSYLPPGDNRGHGTKERAGDGHRFLHLEKSPAAPALTIRYTICPGGLQEAGAPAHGEPPPLRWGAA